MVNVVLFHKSFCCRDAEGWSGRDPGMFWSEQVFSVEESRVTRQWYEETGAGEQSRWHCWQRKKNSDCTD